jgi:hypothetical protein
VVVDLVTEDDVDDVLEMVENGHVGLWDSKVVQQEPFDGNRH